MDVVISKNDVSIRLTEERWEHITKSHDYMAPYYFEILETIADPEFIAEGQKKELIAVRRLKTSNKYVVVIYRELGRDGFVITAFLTKRPQQIERRKIAWQKP